MLDTDYIGKMEKNIYIRTDMNKEIATGHVMRCLSIEEAAQRNGISTTFILADHEAENLILSKGHRCIVMDSLWDDMESELPTIVHIIQEEQVKSILIDSYMATDNYLSSLRKFVRVAYMDDFSQIRCPLDAIINYSLGALRSDYGSDLEAELFLGCRYAPLRGEFSQIPVKEISPQIKRVLILSGGTDPYSVIRGMLSLPPVKRLSWVDAVCGVLNPDYDELKEKFADVPAIHLYKSASNLSELMQKADVAISAGGTTVYELFATGTPVITYSMADNQLKGVHEYSKSGLAEYAGDVRSDDVFSNTEELLFKYEDPVLRERMSQQTRNLVDGKGAERIVDVLLSL